MTRRNRVSTWLLISGALLGWLRLLGAMDPVLPPWAFWCVLATLMLAAWLAYQREGKKTAPR